MSVPAGKIPPSPYITINDDYIEELAKQRLNFTPGKGYKVKRTVPTSYGERQYMILDNDKRYVFVSPKNCEVI